MADQLTEVQEIEGLVPVPKDQVVTMLEAGYLFMDMGRFDAARDVFAGVAALLPKNEVPQLALGTLEFAQGKHEKALQAYRTAQRINPKSALPRAHAGEALLFLGKVKEAEKELKAAIELDPRSDGARLAQALLEAVDAGALPPPKPDKAAKK